MRVPKGCTYVKDRKTGIAVLRIHYSADPEKDRRWVKRMKRGYPSKEAWQRDQEIDFSVPLSIA